MLHVGAARRPSNGKLKNETLNASNAKNKSRHNLLLCRIFSTRNFYGFIPKPLTPPLRPRHSLFIPISFSVLPILVHFIPSHFSFHFSPLFFLFLYPVLWLLTMTSSKGTSCPHLFFRVGIFEGFKLTHHRKPFQVISKLGVRYTGVFDHINQEDQTICLAQGMSLSLL